MYLYIIDPIIQDLFENRRRFMNEIGAKLGIDESSLWKT